MSMKFGRAKKPKTEAEKVVEEMKSPTTQKEDRRLRRKEEKPVKVVDLAAFDPSKLGAPATFPITPAKPVFPIFAPPDDEEDEDTTPSGASGVAMTMDIVAMHGVPVKISVEGDGTGVTFVVDGKPAKLSIDQTMQVLRNIATNIGMIGGGGGRRLRRRRRRRIRRPMPSVP